MRDKIGIDKDAVRRTERSIRSEEHVRRGSLDVACDFLVGLWFGLLGGFLEAFVAGFDCALHLLRSVVLVLALGVEFEEGREGMGGTDLRELLGFLRDTHFGGLMCDEE
jgi:hypothetical protein